MDERRFRPDKTEVPQLSPGVVPVDPVAALNLAFLDAMYHREQLERAVGRQDAEVAVKAATAAADLMLGAFRAAYQLAAESDSLVRHRVHHIWPGMHRSRAALIAEIDRLAPQLVAADSRELLGGIRRTLALVADTLA